MEGRCRDGGEVGSMKVIDLIGHVGHRVHIARGREARMLFGWMGDLKGLSLLDVGGGDGYWAGQTKRKGAFAVSVDLDLRRTERGSRFTNGPLLVRGDALRLPFADASFDAVVSISSIEHFSSVSIAIAEMARVLRPGGRLALSADSLAGAHRWPRLAEAHRERYAVAHPLEHDELAAHLTTNGFTDIGFAYLFKRGWANRLYLELSRHRLAWNVAAPMSPMVSISDRRSPATTGSIVLVHARRQSGQEPSVNR